MEIANYRIFGKLFRGKAGNLNGNSPIKHVYKVTGQFTLVIAGNNVESNGNSSLKLDRNGPRYILSPPPPLSSSLPNSLFPSREEAEDYAENRVLQILVSKSNNVFRASL